MPPQTLSLKSLLRQVSAVASGVAGVMAVTNLLASKRRNPQPRQAAPAKSQPASRNTPPPATSATPSQPPQNQPELRPGWQRLDHTELPAPSYWPAVLALGITFMAWGLVTSIIISVVGLVLFVVALAGWIGAMRHDH